MIQLIRTKLLPQNRENIYMIATILVAAIGTKANLDGQLREAILTVVISSLTLLLAAINAETIKAAAVYAFLGAVSTLGLLLAPETSVGWVGWIGLCFAVLGQIIAALRTPAEKTVINSAG